MSCYITLYFAGSLYVCSLLCRAYRTVIRRDTSATRCVFRRTHWSSSRWTLNRPSLTSIVRFSTSSFASCAAASCCRCTCLIRACSVKYVWHSIREWTSLCVLPRNQFSWWPMYTHTHPFNGPFSGTTQVKPIWILLKQETVTGSGISWAIYKSAPRSRHITTPTPHHSVFYRPDALPATQPTASKHWWPMYCHKNLSQSYCT